MKKILIIDDDKEFVEIIKQILETNDYQVASAGSGSEGLEKAKTEQVDLFIIDVMMETWSEGFNVVEALSKNEQTRRIPRILLTGIGY